MNNKPMVLSVILFSVLLGLGHFAEADEWKPWIHRNDNGTYRVWRLPFDVPVLSPRVVWPDDEEWYDEIWDDEEDTDEDLDEDRLDQFGDDIDDFFEGKTRKNSIKSIEAEDEREWDAQWKGNKETLQKGEVSLRMKEPYSLFQKVDVYYDPEQKEPVRILNADANFSQQGRRAEIHSLKKSNICVYLGGELNSLFLEGNYQIHLKLPEGDSFLLQAAGHCDGTVIANRRFCRIDLAGAHHIQLAGSATDLHLLLLGGSSVDAAQYEVKNAVCHVYGASKIRLKPEETLEVMMRGVGYLQYKKNSSLRKKMNLHSGTFVEEVNDFEDNTWTEGKNKKNRY